MRFRPTIHPDNRPHYIEDENKDLIVIGGSCINTFKLDFNYLDYVKTDAPVDAELDDKVDLSRAKVIYRQGLDVVLEKYPEEFRIDEHKHYSYLTVILSPEETSLFSNNYLDVKVQVMVENNSGNLLYDIPSKLRVMSPLDFSEDISVHSLER